MEVITSVMTSPYHFYFVFVPRVASNRKEVRFGEVAVLKLILCCHQKKSYARPERRIDLQIFEHMPQGEKNDVMR